VGTRQRILSTGYWQALRGQTIRSLFGAGAPRRA
jgi:hypothetical protein